MKITVDEILLTLDLQKASEYLKEWYKNHKQEFNTLTLPDGRSVDFGPKSVLRLGLKTAMLPVIVPVVRMLYMTKGAEPRKKEKHEDLIDWFVEQLICFVAVMDKDAVYVETLEGSSSYSRTVNSVSTHVPNYITTTVLREAEESKDTFGPGRETLVHSRENGDGQDQASEGDNTQEDFDTTVS